MGVLFPGLSEACTESVNWSNDTFPTASARSKAAHLLREATELAENPTDGEEMADVMMLLAHLAAGEGIDLAEEVHKKLAKNQLRKWGVPDGEGVVEHIREGE